MFEAADAETLWCFIVDWAEHRSLGIGGSYRPEGDAFLYEYGICATRESQLIDEDDVRELLNAISAAVSDRGLVSGNYRPFTDDESDPSRLDRVIELLRRSIN